MAQCSHGSPHPTLCPRCNSVVDARVIGIAVEGGKNVVHLIVNGSRVTIDTNILGFAHLAKLGVKVIGVQAAKEIK